MSVRALPTTTISAAGDDDIRYEVSEGQRLSVNLTLENNGLSSQTVSLYFYLSTDDRIRLAEYRAIYSEPSLQKYGLQAVPPIHIIVNNGNVTLVGVVANQTDRNLADIRAKGVPGVFSVTDNLRVEQ